MSRNPLILYHGDCVDGYGAAFSAWLKFRDQAEYAPVIHGRFHGLEDLDRQLPDLHGRDVYIIDFSFTPALQAEVRRRARKVIWLDHHATSFEQHVHPEYLDAVGPRYRCCTSRFITMLDNDKAGCRLAWEHFFPGRPLPRLLAYIDDFDRQALELPNSRGFNVFMRSTPWSFELWEQWLRDFGDIDEPVPAAFEAVLQTGLHLEQSQSSLAQSIAKDAIKVLTPGEDTPGLAVACPMLLVNDVGMELVRQSGSYALCWLVQPDGVVKASLRSDGAVNVAKLAEIHGGGGHRKMAAFRVTPDRLISWFFT